MRGKHPVRTGSSTERRPDPLRGLRRGAPRRWCRAGVVDRAFEVCKAQIPYCREHSAASRSIGAATAGRTGRGGTRAIVARSTSPIGRGPGLARRTGRRSSSASRSAACRRGRRRPSRAAVKAAILIGTVAPFGPRTPTPPRPLPRATRDHEGWKKYNRDYWRENYPDFADFFLRRCSRAAFDQADRGRGRLGARDHPRTSSGPSRPARSRRRRRRGAVPADRLPAPRRSRGRRDRAARAGRGRAA